MPPQPSRSAKTRMADGASVSNAPIAMATAAVNLVRLVLLEHLACEANQVGRVRLGVLEFDVSVGISSTRQNFLRRMRH